MIFVLLLYFCIDHIDPYFICRTVQNLNKDNLRTYIIGGRGNKKCSKIIAFFTYTHCYFIKACCLNPQQGETLLLPDYGIPLLSNQLVS